MPAVSERLQAALADRYTIQRELGRGGMATVYLAADIKHRRDVALKVIKPEVAHALGSERFLREIEVTGRLDHPHILPLLDSGDAGGLLYYVMPYVDGESLRDRLAREKQLPLEDVLTITREVADALTHAHGRGIVHRDIKPENILLSGGHARVADFGIARAVLQADEGTLTESGLALGTPLYMSPEQSAGVRDLDGRSDLYSLGCVVYEMLAGEPPYTGPTAQAILAKRLRDPVPRVAVVRETVPEGVDQALVRALAKVPADRFATPTEFAAALASPGAVPIKARRWLRPAHGPRATIGVAMVAVAVVAGVLVRQWVQGGPQGSVDPNVIAVLPFRVTAPDSTHNYLREGVVDLLGAQLTGDGVPRAVDSRTTLSAWRRVAEDANGDLTTDQSLAVGRRLGAEQVLLGELVVTPRGKTVSGRLLDSRAGEVLAEHSESGAVDAVLLIHRLVGRLLARTEGEAASRLPALSDSLDAVKAYIAGMRALRGSGRDAARAYFGRALDIDSTFALSALRLTRLGPNPEMIRRRVDQAWALRERLSSRDRALLTTHFAIGPNYPLPTPMVDHLRARERLAMENPDFLEAWMDWGTFVLGYGLQVGWRDAREQAAAAFDHAIALDSTFGGAWDGRHMTAMLMGDKEGLRELLVPYGITNTRGDLAVFDKWFSAELLGDTTQADSLIKQLESVNDFLLSIWGAYAASLGVSLEDPERVIAERMARGDLPSTVRNDFHRSLLHIAALRGRVADVHARADSVTDRLLKITVALADPGYEAVGNSAAELLGRFADSALNANQICYREMWRAHRGDTAYTRSAIALLRALVRDLDPAAFPRVGRFEVCPLLLEAMLEGMKGTRDTTPALDRLDSVMRQGTGLELPGNLATLLVARARAAQGDNRAALDMVRRRPFIVAHHFTIVLPAHLREEGRLAALTGDTAGAIRAYRHYLTLRDEPDPGPMEDEVRLVRSHLAELLGERSKHQRGKGTY